MKLYQLINGIGTYYTIAKDHTEAENKLMEVLNAGDGYGFSKNRKVTSIHVLAEAVGKSQSSIFPYNLTDRFLILDTVNDK